MDRFTTAEFGQCPSCKVVLVLPAGTNIYALQQCCRCGAMSYGYKWLGYDIKEAKK